MGDLLHGKPGDTSIKKIISIIKELISLLSKKEKSITIHLELCITRTIK